MNKEEIKNTLSELIATGIIEVDKIPDIPLYMDQITTFVEDNLSSNKRYEDEKILTKTMINNYTKFSLIEPPVKKKYSKRSIIGLIMVYYFKNILSINDIKELLGGIEAEKNEEYYTLFTRLQKYDADKLAEDIAEDMQELITEATDERQSYILMAMLLIDQANIRKQLAERLIDKYLKAEEEEKNGKKKADKKS